MRHQQTQQRPDYGIHADEGVVGQEGQREKHLSELAGTCIGHAAQMHGPCQIRRLAKHATQRQQSGECDNGNDQKRPQAAEFRKQQPCARQQQHQRNRDEAAPQVVEYLPLRQHGKRIGNAAGASARHTRQQPLRDLPIAAYPSVTPGHVHVIAGRIFLE